MAKLLPVVAAVVLLAAAAAASPALAPVNSTTTTPTAYEMLERYDFPRGILPQGVKSYVLRPDGSFEVFLSGGGGDCEFRVGDRYVLRYSRRIAGIARSGSISALEGVSVKVFFVWIGINQVDRAGNQLNFLVGPLSASFPLGNFAESPRCHCGFDCATSAAVAAS